MPERPAPQELSDLITFTEAAKLTGQPKAYLRELVEAGRLAVHLRTEDGRQRTRLSRPALLAAGLLQPDPAPEPDGIGELTRLVREQSARLAALEDQRFQLGAQLGAALERIAALETRAADRETAGGIRGSARAIGRHGARRLDQASRALRDVRLALPARAHRPGHAHSGGDN